MTVITQTRYCTLYRIGFWCSLDAECKTEPDSGGLPLITHTVAFRIINGFGERLSVGLYIINGNLDGLDVFDEDGEAFPSLEAAIENYANKLTKLTAMPGRWTDTPSRHDTWQGTTATAFDATPLSNTAGSR